MVKVQVIVEQNKNAHPRTKKMKPKDCRAKTCIKCFPGFYTKIVATRAARKCQTKQVFTKDNALKEEICIIKKLKCVSLELCNK